MKEIFVSRLTFNRSAWLSLALAFNFVAYSDAAQERPPAPSVPPPPGAPVPHRPVGTLPPKAPATSHPLVWDAMKKTHSVTAAEGKAEFTFWVTNTSKVDVIINNVQPSCGCTTPLLPPMPWKLVPGTNGSIKASMDIKGKTGNVTKTLTVMSTAGHQVLTIEAQIAKDPIQQMADRQANIEIAKADPQAVFKGDCRKCHVEPTVGKMGEQLFATACAICHNPEQWAQNRGEPTGSHHRNEMVPDLATLDHELTRRMLKVTISNGTGKKNALMPAFSTRNGGPLTDEQIDSLVDYAMQTFKFNPANVKKSAQAEKKAAQP